MKIKFKKLVSEAVAPIKAHETDAGFDLTAVSVEEDRKRNIVTYHTGIAVEIPEGYVGLLFPRSSVFKHQLQLANSVGVIDSGYRGEIMLKFRIVQPHISRYSYDERVGQLIILPYPEVEFNEVEELEGSDRGEGGFGSSDKKQEQSVTFLLRNMKPGEALELPIQKWAAARSMASNLKRMYGVRFSVRRKNEEVGCELGSVKVKYDQIIVTRLE